MMEGTSGARQARAEVATRLRQAGVAGAATMMLSLSLLSGPLFPERLFDFYQRLRQRDIAASRVLVVRIDDESIRTLGPWPWPRSYIAKLTDRLREGGASAVGYDFLFAESDVSDPRRFAEQFPMLSPAARAEIKQLAPLDALSIAFTKVPAVVARVGISNGTVASRATHQQFPVSARFVPRAPQGIAAFPLAAGNVEALELTAAGHGVINGEPDADGVTRRMPMMALLAGVPTPGLALDLVRVALGRRTIEVTDATLRVGGHVIPIAAAGSARLWFGTLPYGDEVSAVDVLREPRTLHSYRGRIAIIGPAAVGLSDIRLTPLGNTDFGVRIHAQAVDAVLRGGWLKRPAWAVTAEWALGAGFALILILGFPNWDPSRSAVVAVALSVATFAGSWVAFASAQLLLDPVRPVLVGLATATGITIAGFIATASAARRLRESAFEKAGEMKAARDIQQAMLLDPIALRAIDTRLDIDAWLDPAREIGGDLYDAFRLDDARIAFLIGDVTGKGTPAALFMAVSKALARSLLMRGDLSLDKVITTLNTELAVDNIVQVTLLCGIIDLRTGAVDLVNAGHENPWVVRPSAIPEELPMEGGLPLCTLPSYVYLLEHTQLQPDDGLVFITDGVREAQNADGSFFGSERTRDLLAGWRTGEAAHVVTERLVAAVRAFEGGVSPADDLTILALRYRA